MMNLTKPVFSIFAVATIPARDDLLCNGDSPDLQQRINDVVDALLQWVLKGYDWMQEGLDLLNG